MKRSFLILSAIILTAGLTGCVGNREYRVQNGTGTTGLLRGSCVNRPRTCADCRPGLGWQNRGATQDFTPGPPAGSVAYPYYTVRGPRDFLAVDTAPIGP